VRSAAASDQRAADTEKGSDRLFSLNCCRSYRSGNAHLTPFSPLFARAAVQSLAASKIRELYNEGVGKPGVLAFWVGEPDEPTPQFIRDAATASIAAGELFYTHNLGIPELRAALAAYVSRLHRTTTEGEIAVTSAGVNALMLASQLLVDPGDRVVEVVPLWPNLQEIPKILGAQVTTVALDFSPRGWTLDADRLISELKPGTRALYLNSPNNPTGWTITRAEQQALLEHCRRHGIWIFADDAYERLCFRESIAPSFMDIAGPDDRLITANTFSKSWLMTGWRLGWLVVPPGLASDLGKLIEYNTSCAPIFVQRAGIAAVAEGEAVVSRTLQRFRKARDYLVAELRKLARVELAVPDGAMYLFLRIEGVTDSLAFCRRLVREQGLGLAPGAAFGPEGEGYVRWCFAAETERLADGVARLQRAIGCTG
jgi:aspartate/methionine/tyrosine aminotransferase